jgi:hypothetical protein
LRCCNHFETDDTAPGGRNANRTAAIGPHGSEGQARGKLVGGPSSIVPSALGSHSDVCPNHPIEALDALEVGFGQFDR